MNALQSLDETLDTLIEQQQLSFDIAEQNDYHIEKYALDKVQESLYARMCFLIEKNLPKIRKRITKQKKHIDQKIRLFFLQKGTPIPKWIRTFLHKPEKAIRLRPRRLNKEKCLVKVR